MGRSKLRRDRLKGGDKFSRMNRTIKHLKHSISYKDREINILREIIKSYEELEKISNSYIEFMNHVKNDTDCISNKLDDMMQEIKSIYLIGGYPSRRASEIINRINRYKERT